MCSTAILGAGNKKILAENYDFNLDHGLIAVSLQVATPLLMSTQ